MYNQFNYNGGFLLESGEELKHLTIAYHTYGEINVERNNVIWVFHAFSANSDVQEWWPGMFGKGSILDPEKYFIICANILGSPYGSSAPKNRDFPMFTMRDVVKANLLLADELDISYIHMGIGGSVGGNQALEFAYSFTGNIENLVLIASCARESAWAIAIHEAQRMALMADPGFGAPDGGKAGLEAARAIGMVTYRTPASYIDRQTDTEERTDGFKASSYIRHQGRKFSGRFNALSYYYLSKCMDSHDIGRGRGGQEAALKKIDIPALIIGIDTDIMIPPELQKSMSRHLPQAIYKEIQSLHGHDGFLIETEKISRTIREFL